MAYNLSKAVTQLGREPDNDISVPNDSQVSRYHAEIRREGAGYTLYDQNSTNGTFVGGRRVTQHTLVEGDEIRIGSATLTYRSGSLYLGGGAVVSSGQAAAPRRGPAPSAWAAPPVPQQRDWTPFIVGAAVLLLILALVVVVLMFMPPGGRTSDEDLAEEIAENWIAANAGYIAQLTSDELLGADLVPPAQMAEIDWLGLPPQSLRDEVYKKVSDPGNWVYDRPIKLTEGVYSVNSTLSFGITNASNGRTVNVVDVYVVTVDTVQRQFKELGVQSLSASQQ